MELTEYILGVLVVSLFEKYYRLFFFKNKIGNLHVT